MEPDPAASLMSWSERPGSLAVRSFEMRVMVLAVPNCPNAMLLEERLARVLDGRRDVSVSRQVIEDEQEAARQGMHGSPTILVDGTYPFAEPGQPASVSCRLYRDSDGRVDGAPTVSQLREVIGEPAAAEAGSPGWLDALGRSRPRAGSARRVRPPGCFTRRCRGPSRQLALPQGKASSVLLLVPSTRVAGRRRH
jgi:hypothetical protein